MKSAVYCIMLFILISCEKDIDFDLKESPELLVVDAEIENDKAPIVVLTKSLSYYKKIDPSILSTIFVHDANVYLSNGTQTHKLKEYSYPLGPGISGWYYSIDSSSLNTAFVGTLNTDYFLRIENNNQVYSATTKIPHIAYVPDSIWTKPAPLNPDSNKRVLFLKATDPPGLGNYIRYFTRLNSGPFLPGPNSVANDQVIDGTTYELIVPPGIDRNNPPDSEDSFFNQGDTITIKWCNIDKSTYLFWNSWEFAYQSIGNPFSQPNTVIGNLSNGALGAFCGYASKYITIISE